MLLGIPGILIIYYFFQSSIDHFYLKLFIRFSILYSKLLEIQDKYSNLEVNTSVFLFAFCYVMLFLTVIKRVWGEMNSLLTLLLFSLFLLMALFLLIIRRYFLPIHYLQHRYPQEDPSRMMINLFGIDDMPSEWWG
jgi:hypothetical protein